MNGQYRSMMPAWKVAAVYSTLCLVHLRRLCVCHCWMCQDGEPIPTVPEVYLPRPVVKGVYADHPTRLGEARSVSPLRIVLSCMRICELV